MTEHQNILWQSLARERGFIKEESLDKVKADLTPEDLEPPWTPELLLMLWKATYFGSTQKEYLRTDELESLIHIRDVFKQYPEIYEGWNFLFRNIED